MKQSRTVKVSSIKNILLVENPYQKRGYYTTHNFISTRVFLFVLCKQSCLFILYCNLHGIQYTLDG